MISTMEVIFKVVKFVKKIRIDTTVSKKITPLAVLPMPGKLHTADQAEASPSLIMLIRKL